ncbi:MAG: protein kinase domain-containing protein [Planctomycetota bacterium]
MTTPSSRPAGTSPVRLASTTLTTAVREACERFRSSWRDGTGPTIEQELADLPADVRPMMLQRLLVIEIAEARAAGHSPDLAALRHRFPQDRSIVDGAWEESWRTEPVSPSRDPLETRGTSGSGDTANAQTDPGATRAPTVASDTMTTATRYTRFRHHRKGGMSILRIAHDEDLDRETVVKTLREEYQDGDAFRRQLLAEASITGKLDHPGIVPVYGVGHDWDGRPFYTMRRIDGEDLHSHVDRHHAASNTGMPAEQVLDLRDLVEHLVDACNTIAYAHDAGVLHLDIKPQNIMVGRYGETFVVDWGLARPFERSTEFRNEPTVALREDLRGGLEAFTRPFVSPEQYAGGALGPAADIYSLGATLYFIIAGVTGLRGDEPDFRDRLAAGRVPPARSRRPGVPKALDAICQRAMQAQPSGRYPTAKALAADLQAWLRDEPVSALPERLTDRCLRQVRRHAGIVATAGVALPVVAAAVVAAGVLWRQADREHRNATQSATLALNATRAKEDATLQRKRADARFDAAVNTFEKIANPLATSNWSNVELFGQLARDIDAFSDEFLADSPDETASAPPLQLARIRELKAIAASVSNVAGKMNLEDLISAEGALIKAREKDRTDANLVRRLARNKLLQGQQRFRRDREHDPRTDMISTTPRDLEAALTHFEALRSGFGTSLSDSDELLLAEVHHELGRWYLWLVENSSKSAEFTDNECYTKSHKHFTEGLQIRQALYDKSPSEEATRDLARSFGFRGDLYARFGKLADARADYERSETLRERCLNNRRANIDYQVQYARGLANFVALELIDVTDLDNVNKTIERLKQAAKIQEKLLAEYRHNGSFVREIRRDLAWSYAATAELYLLLGAHDAADGLSLEDAATYAKKAFDLLDEVQNPDDETRRSKYRYRVLLAEARRDADVARDAKKFFEDRNVENMDPDSIWALTVARALTEDDKGASDAFDRLVNRGGKNRAQYEARFQAGGSLARIADMPDVVEKRKTLEAQPSTR